MKRFHTVPVPRRIERRLDIRDTIGGVVSILSEDECAQHTFLQAKLQDISPQGARFLVTQRIPLRSVVMFSYQRLGIGGRGTVRYCNSARAGYEVGLELRNGTGWAESPKRTKRAEVPNTQPTPETTRLPTSAKL